MMSKFKEGDIVHAQQLIDHFDNDPVPKDSPGFKTRQDIKKSLSGYLKIIDIDKSTVTVINSKGKEDTVHESWLELIKPNPKKHF